MPLPPLYVEGLAQHAARGLDRLNVYKLGLVEALLKDALRRMRREEDPEEVAAVVRTALEVTMWELPPPWRGA
ncbi:MAG: hypothetical protein M3Q48_08880 [Actinomycetota bacterium]|nr:hypothetical protein [Actinomycetota bacterium]